MAIHLGIRILISRQPSLFKKNLCIITLPRQMFVSMPQSIFVMVRPNFPLNNLTISI